MIRLAAAMAAVCVLAAACSSSGSTRPAASTPGGGTTAAPAYTARLGDTATAIAGHITGCGDLHALPIGDGGKTGMVSAASCVLDGNPVIVDTWSSSGAALIPAEIAGATLSWYAYGPGWTAFLGDPGQPAKDATVQLQLTNAAGDLLDRGVTGNTPAPAPAADQRRLATTIARDLGGTAGRPA